jgi:hypothetical protein
MSLKNSVDTGQGLSFTGGHLKYVDGFGGLLMPSREVLDIVPTMISPLKGRKTIKRNSTAGIMVPR